MNDSLPGFLPKPPSVERDSILPDDVKAACFSQTEDISSETTAELSRPLYDISHDWHRIVDHLIEAGGEMTPENLALWDGIQGEAKEKLEACAMMIQTLTSNRDAIKAEAKRMSDRAKVAGNKVDGLKRYAQTHMEAMGMKRAEGVSVSMRIQNNAASCEVLDDSLVPVELVSVAIKMSGSEWKDLVALLSRDENIRHDVEDWTVSKTVDKKAVVKLWNESHESEQTPGTVVSKGSSLRLC